ncbi:MAG: hypothetical protein C4K60_03320 [Ideonella sp. MAG2]|nr:MAG: hypothetical protein C4K60_03320 [Ideonella sp. MAG2]
MTLLAAKSKKQGSWARKPSMPTRTAERAEVQASEGICLPISVPTSVQPAQKSPMSEHTPTPATPTATAAAASHAQPQLSTASPASLAAAVVAGGQVVELEGFAMMQVPGQEPQALSTGATVPPGAVLLTAIDAVVRLSKAQNAAAKASADRLNKVIADLDKGTGDAATAAGVTGGDETTAEGGLRVDRVSESTNPSSKPSQTQDPGGSAPATSLSPSDTDTPTGTASIYLDNPGLTNDATPRLSGSTTLPPGTLLSITVTDSQGQVQIITTAVGADGRFEANTAALPDGVFKVNVQAQGSSVSSQGTVDTTPPTLRLDAASLTNDSTPTISGQSDLPEGSVVKVTVVDAAGKAQELTATVGPNGRFSVSPDQALAEGRYTVQVVATDAAGNTQTSTTVGVLDTTAPEISISAPSLSNSTQPTLVGRTDLGNGTSITVKITDSAGQTQTSEAVVRPDGSFSLTPSQPLPDGPFTVEVTGRDLAGNTRTSTSSGTIDSSAPLAPSIDRVIDDQGPIQGPLNPGGTTDDSRPTLEGKGEPGSTITVYANGVAIGSTKVDPSGEWRFTPEVPLPGGPNSITTTATDPAGNTGPSSPAFSLNVEMGAPQVPSIISATDDVSPQQGLLAKSSSTNDNTPTLNGFGRPGETVTLFADGNPVGSAVVNAKGEWSITPAALGDKTWNFSAMATNANGVQSPQTGLWPLTIDTQAPRQPAIDAALDNVGPVQGNIAEGSTIDDATPTWQGKNAEPGSLITVYDKGTPLGQTTVGPDGSWSFTPARPLPDGQHLITITAIDAAENVSTASTPLSFTVDTSQVLSPSIDQVTEGRADGAEAPLVFNQASPDNTPTLNGSSKPNQVIQVFDGDTLLGQTTADAQGRWTLTPSTPLPDGPHDFVAVSLNAAGVASEPSNLFRVVVDTVAPDTPWARPRPPTTPPPPCAARASRGRSSPSTTTPNPLAAPWCSPTAPGPSPPPPR